MIRLSFGRRLRSVLLLALATGVLLAAAPAAHATDYFAQPGTGNWTDASTWSPPAVPNSFGDTVTIPAGATVNLASTIAIGSVAIDGGTLNVNAGGQVGPISFAINSGTVSVAGLLMPIGMTIGGSGTLNLHDGGVARVAQDGSIAGTEPGAITIGPGIGVLGQSGFSMAVRDVHIGGTGTLRIAQGASVSLDGTTSMDPGAANVRGTLVVAGQFHAPTGPVTVDNGGRIVGYGNIGTSVALADGTIEPSGPAGRHLTVGGAFSMTSASTVSIHTRSATDTQQLKFLSTAQFDGALEIDATDNTETSGTWDLVTATGATGTFASMQPVVALTLPKVGKPTVAPSGVTLTAQDGLPPTAVSNLTVPSGQAPGPSNDPLVDLAWDAATDSDNSVAGYSVEFTHDPTTVPDLVVETTALNLDDTPLADGTWYAHVRAIDDLGMAGPTVHSGPIVIDTVTATPTLTAPAAGSRVTNPLHVAYDLGENPLAGSATLVFKQGSTVAATWVLSNSRTADAMVDPANPLASPAVVASATGSLTDGTYTVVLATRDSLGNPAASTTVAGVTLDRVTAAPTITSPVAGTTYGGSLPVSIALPETAQPGSVRLVLTPATGSAIELTLSDSVAGVGTVSFAVPLGAPTSSPRVTASTAASIPSGTYSVQVRYRDALGNPATSSAVVASVAIDAATQAPPAPAAAKVPGAITTARITASLPEAALAGSVQLRISGKAGTSTLTLVDQASGAYDAKVRLDQLRLSSGVRSVSGAASLPVGSYTVTLAYRDAAGNPEATSSAKLQLGTPAAVLKVAWDDEAERGRNRFVTGTFGKLKPGTVARLTAVSGTRTLRGICSPSPGRTPATVCSITLPVGTKPWTVTIDVLRGPGIVSTATRTYPKKA